jgi:C4-dicarboxylate transporter DctM subunit
MVGLIFIVLGVTMIFGMPIAMGMVLSAATPMILGSRAGGSINQMITNSFSGADTTPIIAVPLFILAGVIMAEGGISRKLFRVFAYFVGRFTGGLPCAVILTCLFYGAISGSGPATTAAVGAMAIPFLTELGYDKVFCSGMVATAGGLGVIIPPSIPFVLYSLATGVSTSALFIGGVLPGIFIGLCLMVYAVWYCRKHGEDRQKIDTTLKEMQKLGFLRILWNSLPALLSPVIVLGGIYGGVVTPTEAACISVFYSLLVSVFCYRSMSVKAIIPCLRGAVKTYTPLCFLLAFAIAFGRVLTLLKAPAIISRFVLENFSSATAVIGIIVVVFFLMGMVMDTGPAIVILAPILLPIVVALRIHPVHFGVIMVCCLSIGLVTPPFGLDLFVASALCDSPPMTVARQAVPFILAFGVALVFITYVPWLSLALL